MKPLLYIVFLWLSVFLSACGFHWFPNQKEILPSFSNVYSSKFRKKPPGAFTGKCYEKYIKSPYRYSCKQKTFSSFDDENDESVYKKYNIIDDPAVRIKHNNPLWVEVICDMGIHPDFAERLNVKLIQAGFLNPKQMPNRRVIDFRTKTALTQYQRFYCLPQGTLNMESLVHLGV